jgi:copper chaperone CopZ
MITVWHDKDLSSSTIRRILYETGFELEQESERDEEGAVKRPKDLYIFSLYKKLVARQRKELHVRQCLVCQEASRSSKELDVSSVASSTVQANAISGSTVQVVSGEDTTQQAQCIYLSIGGMTCAACSNTVTRKIEEVAGATEVAVDLLGKSASAVIAREGLVEDIETRVEEAGFECDLISSEPVGCRQPNGIWTVELEIEGMTCAACTGDIKRALQSLSFVRSAEVVSVKVSTERIVIVC